MGAVALSIFGMAVSNVSAQSGSISYIENNDAANTTGVTINDDPIVTAILSQPGTYNGKTYTSWAFLANDGAGSMEIYGASLPGGYTPTVGDSITPTGEYSPYHQIPELETLTGLTLNSSGNSIPSLGTATIPQLNVATLPYSLAGYLVNVDDVTLSGFSGSFGTANLTGTVTDAGNNSMTLYYWPTSYSVANVNLDGFTPIAGQEYDIMGFDSVYNGSAEFTPIAITAVVPEPSTLVLAGIGGLFTLTLLRRTRKA